MPQYLVQISPTASIDITADVINLPAGNPPVYNLKYNDKDMGKGPTWTIPSPTLGDTVLVIYQLDAFDSTAGTQAVTSITSAAGTVTVVSPAKALPISDPFTSTDLAETLNIQTP